MQERKADRIEVLGWEPLVGVKVGYLAMGTGLPSRRQQALVGWVFLDPLFFPTSICVQGSLIFNPTLLLTAATVAFS